MSTPSITLPRTESAARQARRLNPQARDLLLLVNRKAGAGRAQARINKVCQQLTAAEYRISVLTDPDALCLQAAELAAAGRLRAVLSAGGDGTFGVVLNNLPPGTPIALLPMGTENLLARYLTHGRKPQQVLRLLNEGVAVPLDAVQAGDRRFAMVLSAGFDAEVIQQVHGARRGNITHLAYVQPILQSLWQYRFPQMRVRWSVDGEQVSSETHQAETAWTFAMNLPRYAMNIPIAPQAVGTDGLLDMSLVHHGSVRAGLTYLGNALRGREHRPEAVTRARVTRLRIEPLTDEPIPYQVDGDPGGFLPVEVAVVAEGMHLVVLPKVAQALGFELPAT